MLTTTDRIFPLCELLLGAAYADGELHRRCDEGDDAGEVAREREPDRVFWVPWL